MKKRVKTLAAAGRLSIHDNDEAHLPITRAVRPWFPIRLTSKRLLVLVVIALLFLTPGSLLAQGDSPITAESEVEYRFGQIMRFKLSAESDAPIDEVTLFISAPELLNTLTSDIEVDPRKKVTVEQTLDLTQYRLAPFTTVNYWWRVKDQAGNVLEVPQAQIEYVDDQFAWRVEEQDGVIVHWTGDGEDVGEAAIAVVADSLPRVQAYIPFDPPDPLHIYVYPSSGDLQSALRLTGRDWVGGHAHPELGVILLSAINPRTAAVELDNNLRHELVHLLVYEAIGNNYEAIPLWFEEGLATFFEGSANGDYQRILEEAVDSGDTIPFTDLCRTFPTDKDGALLAYAQSVSLIRYVQAEYGDNGLERMILALADGADCQTLTVRALGISLEELNEEWLDQNSPQTLPQRLWRQGGLLLVTVFAGFLLMSLIFFGLPKLKRG
jgi:hypothetical protein